MLNFQIEQICSYLDQWVLFSSVNVVMFIGLIVIMTLISLLFYIYGIIINLYSGYGIECNSQFWTAGKCLSVLFLLWSAVYLIVAVFSSIGLLHILATFTAAFFISFVGVMLLALLYYILHYCIIFPFLSFRESWKKRN